MDAQRGDYPRARLLGISLPIGETTPVTARHNRSACGSSLPLSEVGAGGRLTHTVARYLELNPRRRRYPADLIAARIRRDGGDVWGAVLDYGISYAHACRIRRGWRPGRRTAERIERAA